MLKIKLTLLCLLWCYSNSFGNPKEITIMSWNIFMVPPVIFKSCQEERAYLIADYIKTQQADIVVLEETFMKSTRKILQDSLQSVYPYLSKITKRGVIKSNSGIWILSKYPLQNQHFSKYKKRSGSDVFSKKGAVFTEVVIENKRVQIIATHTQSLKKFESTRNKQFIQLKSTLADVYLNDTVPQFIIGDLNCDYYDTMAYQTMLENLDVLPTQFSGETYSWDGQKNELAYTYFDHTQETLDYILLRKQHAKIAKIHPVEIKNPTANVAYCKKPFQHLSDHHPIISRIELK